jgi:hypothetical protein
MFTFRNVEKIEYQLKLLFHHQKNAFYLLKILNRRSLHFLHTSGTFLTGKNVIQRLFMQILFWHKDCYGIENACSVFTKYNYKEEQ